MSPDVDSNRFLWSSCKFIRKRCTEIKFSESEKSFIYWMNQCLCKLKHDNEWIVTRGNKKLFLLQSSLKSEHFSLTRDLIQTLVFLDNQIKGYFFLQLVPHF
jgi:hypothetical protein